jgi:hypothetical protein
MFLLGPMAARQAAGNRTFPTFTLREIAPFRQGKYFARAMEPVKTIHVPRKSRVIIRSATHAGS